MKYATLLWTFFALMAQPFYVMLGFYATYAYFSYPIETNVRWVNVPVYWSLLLFFLYLRFALLKALMVWKKRAFYSPELWRTFLKNHLWGALTIPLFIAFSLPVEGNIAGFFYVPYGLLLCVFVMPIIFYKNMRLVFPKDPPRS